MEFKKERWNNYYQKNKEKILEQSRKRYAENREKSIARVKEYYQKNKEKKRSYDYARTHEPGFYKKLYEKTRREMCDAYGGHCVCCGETIWQFLTVHHKNNDGNEHRKTVPSHKLLRWLKKNKYPDGFELLCWNCHMSLSNHKYCPCGGKYANKAES